MGGGQSAQATSSQVQTQVTFDYKELVEKLPYDVLLLILSHVPARDLVRNCALVCKDWRDMADHPTLWSIKCDRAGRKVPSSISPEDYKRIYIKNPYGRNLVRNSCAKEELQHWIVERQGGDRFAIEPSPSGHSDDIWNALEEEEVDRDVRVWATSYDWCSKYQDVDLMKEGCSEYVLDKVRPPILVKEMYSSRFDCGCKYEFEASLLDHNKKAVKTFQFQKVYQQWENKAWEQVQHTFTDYDAGVRYVRVKHRGKDTQFWAGHYGSKFTMSTVRVLLP